MAEYIDRDALLAEAKRISGPMTGDGWDNWGVYALINRQPAADVRPVVLCRDCKHKGWVQEPEHGKSVDYCRLLERCVDKQFFCAAGERKTNCGADMS